MSTKAALEKDPLYQELFDVSNEVQSRGHVGVEELYPRLAELRLQGAVVPGALWGLVAGHDMPGRFTRQRPHMSCLSFEICSKVLGENRLYSSELYNEMLSTSTRLGDTILNRIGKSHARLRASIQPMMTREEAMSTWQDRWIVALAGMLLDDFAKDGRADLNQQLCARLPMHTITNAYGMDSERALLFRDNLSRSLSPVLSPEDQEAAAQTVIEVISAEIADRRVDPRDDIITRMAQLEYVDENDVKRRLTDYEILSFSRLLLQAGGGTTWRQLGITLFALLTHRDQWEAIREDRTLVPQAVQEAVRWNCTNPLFFRLSTEDSVLAGVDVPAGTILDVCLGAANRDPARWDNPDAFDIFRPQKRHLGFASGPHMCLGRFVAESEMIVAINALLDRFPALRLDDEGEPARITGGLETRGVNHLRVRFD